MVLLHFLIQNPISLSIVLIIKNALRFTSNDIAIKCFVQHKILWNRYTRLVYQRFQVFLRKTVSNWNKSFLYLDFHASKWFFMQFIFETLFSACWWWKALTMKQRNISKAYLSQCNYKCNFAEITESTVLYVYKQINAFHRRMYDIWLRCNKESDRKQKITLKCN